MTNDDSRQIITQLATLTESVAGLRRDGEKRDEAFEQERVDSHQSRRELHDKVNSAVADIAAVKSDIRVSAEVTAQTRETVKQLQVTVEANANAIAPTVEQMEQVKSIGKIILYVIGGGGVAFATGVIFWGETIRSAVAHWLGAK